MTAITAMTATLSSCGNSRAAVVSDTQQHVMTADTRNVSAMPRAVLYRMSCDCSDLVPIRLSSDGRLVWYPDVTDIRDTSAPIPAGDGWYLDRIGVGDNTVFTDYTLDEYRQLKETPSPDELMMHIKPGCRVTETRTLDMTPAQAASKYSKPLK